MLRNWIRGTLVVGAAVGIIDPRGAGHSAAADIIVGYGPENASDASPALDVFSGLTPLPLTRGEGLSAGTGATFNSSGWTDEPTDYLQWGWTSSVSLDLTHMDLRYDRSTSGPASVDIQLAVNGGAFESIFVDPDVNASGEDVLDIDLSSFMGVNSATFRLFGTGASSGGGTFDIEALTGISPDRGILVSGTAAAVPEPSAFRMAIVGLAGLAATRAWRRRDRARDGH